MHTKAIAAICISTFCAVAVTVPATMAAPTVAAETACETLVPRSNGNHTLVTPRAPQPADSWDGLGRQFNHVLIIVLENQDYAAVMQQPAMRKLAEEGTLFTHFVANFHPSYSNYLAMVGGRYFGARGDVDIDIPARDRTIAALLEAKGFTWKQYAEAFPGHCSTIPFTGHEPHSTAPLYARKHVPFMSFESITGNPGRCANVVSADMFDPGHLPNYAFYSPDMCDDGHDICHPKAPSTLEKAEAKLGGLEGRVEKLIRPSRTETKKDNLDQTAAWLTPFLARIRADRKTMKDTLIVVTFDESSARSNNHIFTLFLGSMVKKGYRENRCYDNYNMLRTIEDNFGIGTLGGEDEKSAPIVHVWKEH